MRWRKKGVRGVLALASGVPLLTAGMMGPGLMLMAAPVAQAQTTDPAAATVAMLDAGLLATMKTPGGVAARARVIAPVLDHTLDIALMTRLSVGQAWNGFAAQHQAALVAAFRALTIAQYARNFDGFSGQRFALAPQVEVRGADRLVRTTLMSPGAAAEQLAYRLREEGGPGSGRWRIIDVYYRSAISQLATRRADFADVVAKGGAPALIAHLNRLAASGQ